MQRNKRKFKLGLNFRAVTARYHQQWISSRDPGRSGGEGERGEARDDDLQHQQEGTRLHVDDELLLRRFRRETTTSKDEAIKISRGGTTIRSDDQRKHPHSNREEARQKD